MALSGNGHGDDPESESYVHPALVSDRDTLSALKKLELKPPSPESIFRSLAKRVLNGGSSPEASDAFHEKFWVSARKLTVEDALSVIREFKDWKGRKIWPTSLRVRTLAGNWRLLHSVLLPGDIVPGDGSRDGSATVDTHFHEPDDELLCELGATEAPHENRDLSMEPRFDSYRHSCRGRFREQDDLPHTPVWDCLDFDSSRGADPLEVFTSLSDEGRALHTGALLNLDTCYESWTMRHTGTNRGAYRRMPCESITIHMLREHGRIRTSGGIVPLSDALGPDPKSPDALHALLTHSKADRLKAAFDLTESTPEFFGEGDPVPLTDVWPGLKQYLPKHRRTCRLVRCERILVVGQSRKCIFHAPDVYLADAAGDDEQHELRLVADELELELNRHRLIEILQRRTSQEIEERRTAVRQCSTDAERLLEAIGEQALRRDLPDSLLAVLESDGAALTGLDLAEAAIATWHTDALKQYKWALEHLDPTIAMGRFGEGRRIRSLPRVLLRVGGGARQAARSLSGSRRSVLAPGASRLPADHRRERPEAAARRVRGRGRTARDDQHADRLRQDPRCRAGDRRGHAR